MQFYVNHHLFLLQVGQSTPGYKHKSVTVFTYPNLDVFGLQKEIYADTGEQANSTHKSPKLGFKLETCLKLDSVITPQC